MSLSRRDLLKGYKSATGNVLICIFQRGAADGLNCLVPYGDPDYYAKRTRIAIPPPDQSDGVIDLDGFFGLNPAAASLHALYAAGRLALVHAAGVPHGTRSHFDAQARVEEGIATGSALDTGWIGRHLANTASTADRPFRATSLSGSVPTSLLGAPDPLAVSEIAAFGLGDLGSTPYQDTLAALFRESLPYAGTAQAALAAMDELAAADPGQFTPANGAEYPDGEAGSKLLQVAQLIKADLGVEVVCLDLGGWDHHENENSYLPASLGGMADALLAFDTDLGAQMERVTVIAMTEFGRRVGDNASNGTDHGTGSLFYALGGGVLGGQIAGVWPGLADTQLANGEDLAITTDTRGLLAQCLERRLANPDALALFPAYVPDTVPDLFV
ncbi:MAG: DUF1501 domain-containing protein [Gammaproteobacteria bacterium]|nr:DUF1501 domain-containing protein [Gammaproteobacteria bacterium]